MSLLLSFREFGFTLSSEFIVREHVFFLLPVPLKPSDIVLNRF